MAVPSTIFAGIPELLRCLAEQIRSRKQLAGLRLTNKAFDAAAAPFLFNEVNVGKQGTQSLRAVADSAHLAHIRKLSVVRGNNADEYDGIVRQMLPKMPLLESFTWFDGSLAAATLSSLHDSCPAIKSIHLELPENMGQQVLGYMTDREYDQPEPSQLEAREVYGRPPLTVFTGLEELTLDCLCEELPWWKSQIVQVLKNSPGLRKLKLSLSVETLFRYDKYDERDKFDSFFDQLCDAYGETGAAPLRLRSLNLGTAMYPYQLTSIQKLTDLSYLHDVYINNKGVYHFLDIIMLYDSDDDESGIAFHAFGPAHSPNLRRFTAAAYRGDVHNAFAATDNPSFTRQLAISCQEMTAGFEVAALLRANPKYQSLPLHLRMLDIDLQRDQIYLIDEDGEQLSDDEMPTAEQVLENLVLGDEGSLEGLMVHLEENPESDSGFEHLDLLINALTKLVNVTQLAIESNLFYPPELTQETLLNAAHTLAKAAPRLRYIRVYQQYWRIWRNGDGNVRLEPLEDREISDVELFSETIWEPEAC